MVGGGTQHLDARLPGDEVVAFSVIHPAHGQQTAQAVAPVHVGTGLSKGVHRQLAHRVGGLDLGFNDLRPEDHNVLVHKVHIAAPDAAQEDALPHPQVVDAGRHGTVQHHMKGGRRTAGDDLQLPSDGFLHLLGSRHQVVHFFRSGLDRAIAPQVGANAQQFQVGQVVLHLQGGGH